MTTSTDSSTQKGRLDYSEDGVLPVAGDRIAVLRWRNFNGSLMGCGVKFDGISMGLPWDSECSCDLVRFLYWERHGGAISWDRMGSPSLENDVAVFSPGYAKWHPIDKR